MTRNDRYVMKSDLDGWDVVKEGHVRATAHARTKASAVAAAMAMTRREGGGEVHVLNEFGKVISSKTVAAARERSRRRGAEKKHARR